MWRDFRINSLISQGAKAAESCLKQQNALSLLVECQLTRLGSVGRSDRLVLRSGDSRGAVAELAEFGYKAGGLLGVSVVMV